MQIRFHHNQKTRREVGLALFKSLVDRIIFVICAVGDVSKTLDFPTLFSTFYLCLALCVKCICGKRSA